MKTIIVSILLMVSVPALSAGLGTLWTDLVKKPAPAPQPAPKPPTPTQQPKSPTGK